MKTIFMNYENRKKNEANKFFYEFTDKHNLRNPKQNTSLANLSIWYT